MLALADLVALDVALAEALASLVTLAVMFLVAFDFNITL